MHCLQCGAENPDQAKFCLNCGGRLAAVCPQCQATLPPQARFCTECGSQLEAPRTPEPPSPTPGFLAERLQRMVPQEYAQLLLDTHGQVGSERRLVTILFFDIKGSTAMAENLDPEDVMEIMNGAFEVLSRPITRHEGTLARLMGDAILAFFGAPLSHEDDAQRACLAALEIVAEARQYAARLEAERGLGGFDVRVGINTGLVVVGEVGSDQRVEYTAMGDAINLAARMEQHAPPGGILISHHTYRHVRGAFDLVLQEPLVVKGKAEPVQTYLVERARPRTFRKGTRGVEGIETPMVGRETELKRLQDVFYTVVEGGECQVVTVVGEAGVGKSRLLYEFDRWLSLQPETLTTFKGRGGQEMQNLPYALLRDLFNRRFEIQESDPASVARDKLVRGMVAGFQEGGPGTKSKSEMKAHIVGQLLGFDFSASPHVQAIGEDAQQLRDRAVIYISEYFRALTARQPVLILLEDIHWADSSSLDAVSRLASSIGAHGLASADRAHGHAPLLIVGAARPSLAQRRPGWGEGRPFYSRLELLPLSRRDSRRLVGEILQRMDQVPAALGDLVASGAEGNPFFLEELIKMLIEEGVIHKGEMAWTVDRERLTGLQVPPTLTGVLQARLDRLPFDQRQVLQQASVVGRLFWNLAVAHIAAEANTESSFDEVSAALAALGGREMVFPRAKSAIQGAHEYLFKHAMLREVTYEGVLKRVRRVYHGLVAEWMIEQTGERAGEYSGLIADHLALAGHTEEAVAYLRRAAEQAAAAYANAEAASYYGRALELTAADNAQERYILLLAREKLYSLQGAREAQAEDLAALEALAEALDDACPAGDRVREGEVALRRANYENMTDDYAAAIVAAQAAVRLGREAEGHRVWGSVLRAQGEYDAAQQQLEQALALARESGARQVEADSLSELGWVFWHQGIEYPAAPRTCWERALHLYREAGHRRGEAGAILNLGVLCVGTGDLVEPRSYYEQAHSILREIGDRPGEAVPLNNLGWVFRGEDDYEGARACVEQALAINREVGSRMGEGNCLVDTGETLGAQGYYAQGEARCKQALRIFREIREPSREGRALCWLGLIRYYQGDHARARAFLEESSHICRDFGSRWVESKSLAVLALVSHAQGDDEAARDYAQQALENGPERYHLGQGDSALALGHALAGLGDAAGADAAYQQALDRYRSSGYCNPPMEALAGLARLELARGDPAQALGHVEGILEHLKVHTLDGTYEPFRIYLTCHRVLKAHDGARAKEILGIAHHLLQERAAGIEEEGLRRTFLEKVPAHRELIEEYARADHDGQSG